MNLQNVEIVNNIEYQVAHSQIGLIVAPDLRNLEILTADNLAEVLDFLKVRPVHTIVMTGFIRDNGLENELNRGKFYGYRHRDGKLTGVALIGHTTLIESRSDEALRAFAVIAGQSKTPIYVMMADGDSIERFWNLYKPDGSEPRLVCTEKLFELNFPFPVQNCKWNLRQASVAEIDQIAEAHAEVAFLESGSNPLEKDPEGFMKRCLRRIEQGRTFVVFENDELVFKAYIISETEDVIYLEGIYVSPAYRGQDVGSSCLSKLSLELLERVENICLLSNLDFKAAHRSFHKAGYVSKDVCTTIFV